jgi:putative pyruvate formate lyase activating enzyme
VGNPWAALGSQRADAALGSPVNHAEKLPNHVECCTAPVLAWIAEHMPDVPVNVMDQYHPDTFCDPRSQKYRPQYAELARCCTGEEIRSAYRHARARGLNFAGITFERGDL